jgi:hypothetical protein
VNGNGLLYYSFNDNGVYQKYAPHKGVWQYFPYFHYSLPPKEVSPEADGRIAFLSFTNSSVVFYRQNTPAYRAGINGKTAFPNPSKGFSSFDKRVLSYARNTSRPYSFIDWLAY